MKIVIESHIPYIQGVLEPFASEVLYLDTPLITAQAVRDADVIITRTRTRCNADLLEGSKVSFIGTATIGTDHIDLDYCRQRGIEVVNAPGCNAPAVAQWVHSTIGHWLEAQGIGSPEGLTLGIVGVGHVGKIVARWAEQLGMRVLLCDPPRALAEGPDPFVTLDEVKQKADVITFHTPLTREGLHATYHLCNEEFLASLAKCRLIMNAARGPICDNEALLHWHGDVALDCWEHEPHLNLELLHKAFVATPHIAGYSSDGKHRGTAMVVEALNAHFGWTAKAIPAAAPYEGAAQVSMPAIMASYNPLADTATLKADPDPARFEALRNHYPLRPELL